MSKKRKNQEEPEDLIPIEGSFIPDDADKKFFSDASNFIDDEPREWVANQKVDDDKLNVKHHSLICHIAILGDTFPDDLFPRLKDKCNQYYSDRKIKNLGVKPENFYTSVLDIEYTYVDQFNEKEEFETVRKKYIDSNLIEYVTPFIKKWYPHAEIFIVTLNLSPGKYKSIHYYWIYRKIRGKYPQKSMKDFVEEHCSHLSYDTFKDTHRQNRTAAIPKSIEDEITPYIRRFYPDAL
jgi:hypothetical protein